MQKICFDCSSSEAAIDLAWVWASVSAGVASKRTEARFEGANPRVGAACSRLIFQNRHRPSNRTLLFRWKAESARQRRSHELFRQLELIVKSAKHRSLLDLKHCCRFQCRCGAHPERLSDESSFTEKIMRTKPSQAGLLSCG